MESNNFIGAAMSLSLLKATWREYARSQVPALILGVITAAVAYIVRWGLLESGAGPLLVLAVTGFVSLAAVCGLCWIRQPSWANTGAQPWDTSFRRWATDSTLVELLERSVSTRRSQVLSSGQALPVPDKTGGLSGRRAGRHEPEAG